MARLILWAVLLVFLAALAIVRNATSLARRWTDAHVPMVVEPGAYEQVFKSGRTLKTALGEILRKAGIKATVVGEPPLFDVIFAEGPMKDYRDTLKGDKVIAGRFNKALRERGIMKGESKYYVSLALTQADIDHTINAWEGAARDVRG